jgi:hypothetical protein
MMWKKTKHHYVLNHSLFYQENNQRAWDTNCLEYVLKVVFYLNQSDLESMTRKSYGNEGTLSLTVEISTQVELVQPKAKIQGLLVL